MSEERRIVKILKEMSEKVKALLYNMGLIADYVVEYGTKDGWIFRKWNSGIAECWTTIAETKSNYSTVNGFYTYYGTVNFPFSFLEPPRYTYNVQVGSGFALPGSATMGRTEKGTSWYALATASGSQTCTASMYVKGLWKEFSGGGTA